jgi:putative component of membrane protein insertase Oxa1/YidC/SpoIIIJ protein YidD
MHPLTMFLVLKIAMIDCKTVAVATNGTELYAAGVSSFIVENMRFYPCCKKLMLSAVLRSAFFLASAFKLGNNYCYQNG